MSGSLVIVGLGPGSIDLLTPAATRALAMPRRISSAMDPISIEFRKPFPVSAGTLPTIASRSSARVTRSPWPPQGRKVAVVSGGDPGVFAMAAAVFEAVEGGDLALARTRHSRRARHHRDAGRRGRSRRAARRGFLRGLAVGQSEVMGDHRTAPAGCRRPATSSSHSITPRQKRARISLGRRSTCCEPSNRRRPSVLFVRKAATPETSVVVTTLAEADPALADMRTLVIIGAAATRLDFPRGTAALGLYAARGSGNGAMSELLFQPRRPRPRHLPRHVRAIYAAARSSRPECQACALPRSSGRSPHRPNSWRRSRRSSRPREALFRPVRRTDHARISGGCRAAAQRPPAARSCARYSDAEGCVAKAPSSRRPRLRKTRRGCGPSASAAASALATVSHLSPGSRLPGWAQDGGERNRKPSAGGHGIGRDLIGIGMRRVDDGLDGFLRQPCGQSVDTAEAADPGANRLCPRLRTCARRATASPRSGGRPRADAPVPRLPSYLRE